MPRIRERSCRNCRPGVSLAMAVVLVMAGGLLPDGRSFAQAVDDKDRGEDRPE